MSTQQRFAILESNSGFVWAVVDAGDALAACTEGDRQAGCLRHEQGRYESVYLGELRPGRGVFDVRIAPADFDVDNGQRTECIEAVAELPRAGLYAWVDADADAE